MDILYITVWWMLFLVVGIINIPLTYLFFKRFFDIGYGFSKTIGFLLVAYLALFGATIKILPFSSLNLYLILFFLAIINLVILTRNYSSITKALNKSLKVIFFQELLFLAALVAWSIVRSYAPDIRSLEKFMDLGFINSILRSKYFPPVDIWFSGKAVNYYWFGHLFAAVPIKLSQIPSEVGYNLMLGTFLGIIVGSTFSIVSSLFASLPKRYAKKAFSAGVISLLLVAFAGNLHTPIYIIKNGVEKYWYPDATRFIGYSPETNDKTIHEFPIYSFVVSDLHAHLLDVPFTLLFLGLMWSFIYKARKHLSFRREIGMLLFPGLLLATMIATNTWDFASYLLAAILILGISGLINKNPIEEVIIKNASRVFILIASAIVFALPFLLHFSSIAEGIRLVHSQSPIWQLGVLWGFPAIMSVIFVLLILFVIKRKIKMADGFILALLLTSWTLIAIPEVVFVKDIYIASHYRANTMFKLTYQAYIMFYLSAGYIAVRVLSKLTKPLQILSIGFFSLLFSSILIYPFLAVNSYYGKLKNYQGLSGDSWLKTSYPETYLAIDYFRNKVKGQPVILEAPGNSYTDYNVISSYTGLPTIQGWFVHEWLWRGSPEENQKRVEDVSTIYTTSSTTIAKMLLAKYSVSYVIVGSFERERFPTLYEEKFLKLGKKVFSSGQTSIYLLDN